MIVHVPFLLKKRRSGDKKMRPIYLLHHAVVIIVYLTGLILRRARFAPSPPRLWTLTGSAQGGAAEGEDDGAVPEATGSQEWASGARTGRAKLKAPQGLAEYKNLLEKLHRKKLYTLTRDLYGEMILDGVVPDHELFELLVQGSVQAMCPNDALYFFGQVREMGMQPTPGLYSGAIRAYGMKRDIRQAERLGEEIRAAGLSADEMIYTALLSSCAAVGDVQGAERIVREMQEERVPLGRETLRLVLIAAKNCPPTNGADPGTELIEMHDELQRLVESSPAVLGSEAPDAVEMDLMNAALEGAVDLKRYDVLDQLLSRLRSRRLTHNRATYGALLRAELQQMFDTGKEEHFDRFLELALEMRVEGFRMQASTIVMGIDWALKGRGDFHRRAEVVCCLLEEKRRTRTYFTRYDGSVLLSLACRKRWVEESIEPARAIWQALRDDGQMPTRVALKNFSSALASAGPVYEDLWQEVSSLQEGRARRQVPEHFRNAGDGDAGEGDDTFGSSEDSDSSSSSDSEGESSSGSDSDSESSGDNNSDSDSDNDSEGDSDGDGKRGVMFKGN